MHSSSNSLIERDLLFTKSLSEITEFLKKKNKTGKLQNSEFLYHAGYEYGLSLSVDYIGKFKDQDESSAYVITLLADKYGRRDFNMNIYDGVHDGFIDGVGIDRDVDRSSTNTYLPKGIRNHYLPSVIVEYNAGYFYGIKEGKNYIGKFKNSLEADNYVDKLLKDVYNIRKSNKLIISGFVNGFIESAEIKWDINKVLELLYECKNEYYKKDGDLK
jgi:hypothetical protein